jgi:hypothetical protein
MARSTDYAPSTIHRIWRAFGLQPHRSKSFKLSSDPFWEYEDVREAVQRRLDENPWAMRQRLETSSIRSGPSSPGWAPPTS